MMLPAKRAIEINWREVFAKCDTCIFNDAVPPLPAPYSDNSRVRMCRHPMAKAVSAPNVKYTLITTQILDENLCSEDLNWYVPKETDQ